MRLVTWNCNGAFRRKFETVSALDPDLLVIQECEDPAFSSHDYRTWAGNYIWTGKGKNKGIGIFPRRGQSLERLDWPDSGFQMFLPVRVDHKIDLIAVWTQRSAQTNQAYIGQFWHYMQLHKSAWCENTIICGDFNSNTIWDQARRHWNHTDCVRELDELGFRSLYHQTLHRAARSGGEGDLLSTPRSQASVSYRLRFCARPTAYCGLRQSRCWRSSGLAVTE